MNIVTRKSDYIWSYVASILKFGVNIFVFPLVLSILTKSEFGLWVTFASIGSIINLFDFGFSSTILRNLTYVWGGAKELQADGYVKESNDAKRDDRLFVLTLQTCKKIYGVIGLSAVVVSFSFGTIYILYLIQGQFQIEYVIAWLIYSASIGLNLYYAYWTTALRSIGAIKQSQIAIVISICIQLLISYVGLLCGLGLIALSAAACICGFTIRIVSRFYFMRLSGYNEYYNRYSKAIDKGEIRESFRTIWFNAKRAGVSSIATVSISQCTTLICSAFYGLEVAGVYGLCLQVLNMLASVAQIFYQTTIPKLTQARQHDDEEKCKLLFSMSTTVGILLYFAGCAAVYLLGAPLLRVIESKTQLDLTMFTAIAILLFGEMYYSMNASYISLSNRLPFVRSVVISAIIIIPLSLLVAYMKLSILSLIGVRVVVEGAYIFWKWPYEAQKQLQTNPIRMLADGIQGLLIQIPRRLK